MAKKKIFEIEPYENWDKEIRIYGAFLQIRIDYDDIDTKTAKIIDKNVNTIIELLNSNLEISKNGYLKIKNGDK